MSVAFLNLRFEVSDSSDLFKYLNYTAKGFQPSLEKPSKSFASAVSDSVPPTPDETREITIADYRGRRKLRDIVIETCHSENFKVEEINSHNTSSLHSMSKDSHSSTGTRLETGTSKEVTDQSTASSKLVTKEVKFQPIREEDNGSTDTVAWQQSARPKSQSPTPKAAPGLHFYSGNPSVEKVKGILHIYKDNHLTSTSEGIDRSELICMLAVPARLTIHDLLMFNGPCLEGIEYMKIIRDGSPNQYMVLVKFRSQKLADEYFSTYNNTTYNSIESDVCHLVYVGKVEMLRESENACFPVPGMTELPNCPVCLERMDESVDGILTILCNHAFHMECLDQWGDTSCPVCRYCQTPEEVADNRCMKCGSQESLWICLICGNIGCGRYVGLHAFKHFQETQHTYAMELGNNKVWDYVGDNYVHRLIQNKSDGKLVQVDEGGNPVHDEKLDSLNLEYTYLLTNQLESQRLYFEEKIDVIEKVAFEKVHVVEDENQSLAENCRKYEHAIETLSKEKQTLDKKCSQMQRQLKKALHDLQEEKEMNKCLLENQSVWQQRVTGLEVQIRELTQMKDKELTEMKEQLRDIMFYVEGQQKLAETTDVSQEEIQDSQVIVGAAAPLPQTKRTRKKNR